MFVQTTTPNMSLCKIFIILLATMQLYHLTRSLIAEEVEQNYFELTLASKKNLTGHWITQFNLNKKYPGKSSNWKLDLKHNLTKKQGINSLYLMGVITVPPSKPEDYEQFPGVGYYKFHHGIKVTFAEAQVICAKEGGHLAILNSNTEANAIKSLYARHSKAGGPWSYVGFHDPNRNREFITIFGQALSETGYAKWHAGQPENVNSNQFCGCILQDGLYADVGCEDKLSFFCEYDLSWD